MECFHSPMGTLPLMASTRWTPLMKSVTYPRGPYYMGFVFNINLDMKAAAVLEKKNHTSNLFLW